MLDERYRQLLNAIEVGLIVINASREISAMNLAACDLLGCESEQWLGKPWCAAPFGCDLDVLSDEHAILQTSYTTEKGDPKRLQYQSRSLKPDCEDHETLQVLTVQDHTQITNQAKKRDLLLELTAIGDVLPAILHELKNPLASIMSLVEWVSEENRDTAVERGLQTVLAEVRRMKLGFEGLGAISRKLTSTRKQAVDYGMREACAILAPLFAREKLQFEVKIENLPLLPFDAGGIRGILFNLLNNAKQATKSGGRIVVRSGLMRQGTQFWFAVEDSGVGMAADTLQRCTELFYTTKVSGSGIGLALCHAAVAQTQGELQVKSKEGQGTTVTVVLPIREKRP